MKGAPCRIWIIRAVGKLIVFLHHTGLVRYRSRIVLPKIQPELRQNKPLTGYSPSQPSPSRGRSILSVSSQLGKGICKIPSPTRGGLGWGSITTLSFRAATRNRIVGRIMKDEIILKPSILVGDTGSSPV